MAISLNAASLILKDVPDTIFLVVGDGKLRREVEGRAIELGIRNHIIFTGVRKDIPELLNLMDVFVLSSDRGASNDDLGSYGRRPTVCSH